MRCAIIVLIPFAGAGRAREAAFDSCQRGGKFRLALPEQPAHVGAVLLGPLALGYWHIRPPLQKAGLPVAARMVVQRVRCPRARALHITHGCATRLRRRHGWPPSFLPARWEGDGGGGGGGARGPFPWGV